MHVQADDPCVLEQRSAVGASRQRADTISYVESIADLGWWPKTLPADPVMREHGDRILDPDQ